MLQYTKNPLTLDQRGLSFGRAALLAKTDGRGRVDIDSAMPRVMNLLTAAYGGGIPDYIPHRIAGALESWNKGQAGIALTKLTQIHLPDPFTDPQAAARLAKAEAAFDQNNETRLAKDDEEEDGDQPAVDIQFVSPADMTDWDNHPHINIGGRTDPNGTSDWNEGNGNTPGAVPTPGGGHDVSNEPRVPAGSPQGGEWMGGGSDDADDDTDSESGVILVAGKQGATPAEQQAFVDTHLKDAQWAANQLGVPVENILGAAALESGWGTSRFSFPGNNNLFGMQEGSTYATGSIPALKNPKVRDATYDTYMDSFRSLVHDKGNGLRGKKTPKDFAQALQGNGFGINTTNQSKVAEYVSNVAATIRHLRTRIQNSKI